MTSQQERLLRAMGEGVFAILQDLGIARRDPGTAQQLRDALDALVGDRLVPTHQHPIDG